jgi:hypothetical protein
MTNAAANPSVNPGFFVSRYRPAVSYKDDLCVIPVL